VTTWAVGPHAEWAFTSVEWGLAAVEVIALPLMLGFSGVLVYIGGRSLTRQPS
jgi:hypothetical protein